MQAECQDEIRFRYSRNPYLNKVAWFKNKKSCHITSIRRYFLFKESNSNSELVKKLILVVKGLFLHKKGQKNGLTVGQHLRVIT